MPEQPFKKLTIQVDTRSAAILLKSWKEKLAGLETEAQELREQIETLQGQLGIGELPNDHPPGPRARLRAPKGQNLTIILDHLFAEGPKRTTQIADALGLKVSSVSSVLQGNKHRFANTAGLWSPVEEAETPAAEESSVPPMRIRVRTHVLQAPIVVPRDRTATSPPGH